MKCFILVCIVLIASSGTARSADEAKLYTDTEAAAIRAKFAVKDDPKDSDLLNIVANGSTMPIKQIFEKLGLNPKRLAQPTTAGFNHVVFYSWKLSPKYTLSIMTGHNDPAYGDTMAREGYGVRISKDEE